MANWLLKTEPSEYGFESLLRDKRTVWDGVRNGLAVKNLRQIQKGDAILIYHTGDIKAVVGLAEAVSDAYPDPREPKFPVVDIAAKRPLATPVTLAAIKGDARCAGWDMIRLGRLSVVPTSASIMRHILALGGIQQSDGDKDHG